MAYYYRKTATLRDSCLMCARENIRIIIHLLFPGTFTSVVLASRNETAFRKSAPMLEFDNSTLANMTAALDHGCKMLSDDLGTASHRKRIADAIIAAARSYQRSLPQLIEVAEREVDRILGRRERSFFDRLGSVWW